MGTMNKSALVVVAFTVFAGACSVAVSSPTTTGVSTTTLPSAVLTVPPTTPVQVDTPPSDATIMSPDMDVAATVAESAEGTTFVFSAGIYRGVSIKPKDAMTFIARPGVILNGSTIIDSFSQRGDVWVAIGITARGRVHGNCKDEAPMCSRPEDIYIDSVLSQQVATLDRVGPGAFHLDYESGTLTIGDNPNGRTVELTTTEYAFFGTASDVTVDGFIIEKYANPAQTGAIQAKTGNTLADGWVITDNEIRFNHGTGIKIGTNTTVRNNFVHHNGQMGMGSSGGVNNVIEGNEISYNNTLGFSAGWEAGGTKFVKETNLLVRGNFVHDNNGPGLWTDIDNIGVTVEGNTVYDNAGPGIFHEISYQAVIREHTVSGNGFGWTHWLYGAGILIAHSRDVEVTGNIVKDNRLGIVGIQQDRGTGAYGDRELRDLYVHDNVIVASGGSTGIGQDVGITAVFSEWGNRFESNTYYVNVDEYFRWRGDVFDFNRWNAFGNDVDGQALAFDEFSE